MMCESGVRVDEIRVAARTLHPAIDAVGVSWSTVAGVETGVFRHSDNDSEAWLRSPLLHMINTDTRRLRRRLTDPVQRADFPVFQDLAANGVTDYLDRKTGVEGKRVSGRE